MSTLQHRLAAARLRQPPSRAAILVAGITTTLAEWRRRARSRTELARFGEHELRDIGLSPDERWRECNKPFWQA